MTQAGAIPVVVGLLQNIFFWLAFSEGAEQSASPTITEQSSEEVEAHERDQPEIAHDPLTLQNCSFRDELDFLLTLAPHLISDLLGLLDELAKSSSEWTLVRH